MTTANEIRCMSKLADALALSCILLMRLRSAASSSCATTPCAAMVYRFAKGGMLQITWQEHQQDCAAASTFLGLSVTERNARNATCLLTLGVRTIRLPEHYTTLSLPRSNQQRSYCRTVLRPLPLVTPYACMRGGDTGDLSPPEGACTFACRCAVVLSMYCMWKTMHHAYDRLLRAPLQARSRCRG